MTNTQLNKSHTTVPILKLYFNLDLEKDSLFEVKGRKQVFFVFKTKVNHLKPIEKV